MLLLPFEGPAILVGGIKITSNIAPLVHHILSWEEARKFYTKARKVTNGTNKGGLGWSQATFCWKKRYQLSSKSSWPWLVPWRPCWNKQEEKEDNKTKKKSGFTNFLNTSSPRSKRRANNRRNGRGDNDDDNKGVLRKTLVTATIQIKRDATNADVPGGGGCHTD
jgi:hypothetical protein